MKDRVKLLGFAIVSLGAIAFGIANLCSAVIAGRVWGRRGWILFDEQPVEFLVTAGLGIASAPILAAALYMVWRHERSFERTMRRRRLRSPLDTARSRSSDAP